MVRYNPSAPGAAGSTEQNREAARNKKTGEFGHQLREDATVGPEAVVLGEPTALLDPPETLTDPFDDPWGEMPSRRLDPWAEPISPVAVTPPAPAPAPEVAGEMDPAPEESAAEPEPAPAVPADFPAVGEFSGLYGVKRFDGSREEPIEVTEHNRDLLASLTQDDIDNRTEAYYDAGREERTRLERRVTAADITMPENPTPEQVAEVAACIDDAFTEVYAPLDRSYVRGPLQVLSDVYGTPDRAVVAVGEQIAKRADVIEGGGGGEATTEWYADRLEEFEKSERARFEEEHPNRTYYASADLREMQRGEDEKSRTILMTHADAYKAALAEVRPMGGQWALHEQSAKPGAAVVQSTADCWPTSWLEASNSDAFNPLHIGSAIKRAHYTNVTHETFTKRGQGHTVLKGRTRAIYEAGTRNRLGEEINLEPRYDYEASARRKDPGKVFTMYRPMTAEEKAERGWDEYDAADAVVGTDWVVLEDDSIESTISWNARYGRETSVESLTKGFERASDPNFKDGKPFWRKPMIRNNKTDSATVSQIKLSGSAPKGKVHPTRDPRYRAAVHELGHRMEYTVPNLNIMARTWRERRVHECEHEEGRKTKTIYKGTRERGASNGFVNHYVGRSYDHRGGSNGKTAKGFVNATEVFSMGAESVMAGSEGGLLGVAKNKKADPDMRAFILGCMATAGMAAERGKAKREAQGENPAPGIWGLIGG